MNFGKMVLGRRQTWVARPANSKGMEGLPAWILVLAWAIDDIRCGRLLVRLIESSTRRLRLGRERSPDRGLSWRKASKILRLTAAEEQPQRPALSAEKPGSFSFP